MIEIHIILNKKVYYATPRGPKGQGVADRQRGGCISIFAEAFSLLHILNFLTMEY